MNIEVGQGWHGAEPPENWVSVDPGEIYSGVTLWHGTTPTASYGLSGGPNGTAIDILLECVGQGLDFMLIEAYTLYPHLARQQAGSEFLTSQQIGAMKFIVTHKGIPWYSWSAAKGKKVYSLEPYRSWPLRAWKSYGAGPHAKDSEAHGYSWLLKQYGWYPGKPE